MSKLSKINVGIIGAGGIGAHHTKGFQKHPKTNVLAICDNDKKRVEQFAKEHHIPQIYTDYRELMENNDIDAVSVCVPNYLHGVITIAALNRKKHVLCEKPIAHKVSDAEKMLAAAEKNKKFLMIAYHNRFRGETQIMKNIIKKGDLGEIYYAKTAYLRRIGIPGWGGWFTDKSKSGGGPLIDIGVHILDLTLYLMDFPEPKSVVASTYAKFGPKGIGFWGEPKPFNVEDFASGFIQFKNNASMTLECSWVAHIEKMDESYVRLFGTKSGAILDPPTLFSQRNGILMDTKLHFQKTEPYILETAHFIDSILNNTKPNSTGEQGLMAIKILDAMYRSSKSGKQIYL